MPDEVNDEIWDVVEPNVQRALDRNQGDMDAADVRRFVERNDMQLWVSPQCVGVTQIIQYPKKRVFMLFLGAGDDLEEFKQCVDQLHDYARQIGCDAVEIQGRKGWEKVLDMKFSHIVMRTDL